MTKQFLNGHPNVSLRLTIYLFFVYTKPQNKSTQQRKWRSGEGVGKRKAHSHSNGLGGTRKRLRFKISFPPREKATKRYRYIMLVVFRLESPLQRSCTLVS